MGVCDLWSVVEPSQNKRKGAKNADQFGRPIINTIDGMNAWMGCLLSNGRAALCKCTSEGNTVS